MYRFLYGPSIGSELIGWPNLVSYPSQADLPAEVFGREEQRQEDRYVAVQRYVVSETTDECLSDTDARQLKDGLRMLPRSVTRAAMIQTLLIG